MPTCGNGNRGGVKKAAGGDQPKVSYIGIAGLLERLACHQESAATAPSPVSMRLAPIPPLPDARGTHAIYPEKTA